MMVSDSPQCNHQMVTFGACTWIVYQALFLRRGHPRSQEPGDEASIVEAYNRLHVIKSVASDIITLSLHILKHFRVWWYFVYMYSKPLCFENKFILIYKFRGLFLYFTKFKVEKRVEPICQVCLRGPSFTGFIGTKFDFVHYMYLGLCTKCFPMLISLQITID